eukprot:jgi/Chlat1/7762/Chrsp66S07329
MEVGAKAGPDASMVRGGDGDALAVGGEHQHEALMRRFGIDVEEFLSSMEETVERHNFDGFAWLLRFVIERLYQHGQAESIPRIAPVSCYGVLCAHNRHTCIDALA